MNHSNNTLGGGRQSTQTSPASTEEKKEKTYNYIRTTFPDAIITEYSWGWRVTEKGDHLTMVMDLTFDGQPTEVEEGWGGRAVGEEEDEEELNADGVPLRDVPWYELLDQLRVSGMTEEEDIEVEYLEDGFEAFLRRLALKYGLPVPPNPMGAMGR